MKREPSQATEDTSVPQRNLSQKKSPDGSGLFFCLEARAGVEPA